DAQRGIPALLLAARPTVPMIAAATPESAAQEHLAHHADRYAISPPALSGALVVAVHDVGRGGVLVVLRQRVGDVELFRQDVKVLLDRDLQLVAIGGNLHPAAVPSPKLGGFRLPDSLAVVRALGDLYDLPFAATDLERGEELPGG